MEKFDLLKAKLVNDIDEIIEMVMENFKEIKNYEDKTFALDNIKEWAETRKEIHNLGFNKSSYDYLVKYYEERGWNTKELDDVFKELERKVIIIVVI